MQILTITSNKSPGTVVMPCAGPLTSGLISEIAEAWLQSTTEPTLLQSILRATLGEQPRLRRFAVDTISSYGTVISFTMFSRPETIAYRNKPFGYVPRHRSPFTVTLRSAILAAKTVKQLQTYPINHESEYQES